MKKVLAVCVLGMLIGAASLSASTIAYTDPTNQGIQAWPGNLALNFNVLSPIIVTDLGVFNAAGSGVITGTIQVVIYDMTSHTQVTPVVTFHGAYTPAGLGYDVFQAIAPVTLGAGSYQVDAVGFNASDLNGNQYFGSSGPLRNTGGGVLAFAGAAYDSNGGLDNPTTCGSCVGLPGQSSQFDAGTFRFSTVPEPGALGLLGTGVVAAAAFLRRKLGR